MAKKKVIEVENIVENIIERPIDKVMPEIMMPYSEYIIMERALPRVEDGLKPVQRRILYSMLELGLKPGVAYKKSARVVGDCLGKYHPHGDTSVYDAMVRMAQPFNLRMPLVDGHGNFGSIDGDGAAAMRYTEARMAPLAMELLRDIDKDTVSWRKNFDDSLEEPEVLPGRFPNLLVNGAMGIAIGLATNIPPHNFTEVVDGCVAYIDNENITIDEMCDIIKGPDFPTGGILYCENFREIYTKGAGKIVVRSKIDVENTDGDRQNIVVTEIPYNVNKEKLFKKVYKLREEKKEIFGGIVEVADESDRNGMRVLIKLKKGESAEKIINNLLACTDLQANYNMNMTAVAGGRPQLLGLVDMVRYYIEHQREVVYNRSVYSIGIAKKREHIVEGYCMIMPAIDEVIAIIRSSQNRAESKVRLIERFTMSEVQADAILALQLGNINKMDVHKFEDELKSLKKEIKHLQKIIDSVKEQLNVVREELLEVREKYKSNRMSTIVDELGEVKIKAIDMGKKANKKCYLAIDSCGAVKQLSFRNYGMASKDIMSSGIDGLTKSVVMCDGTADVLIFGNKGTCYKLDTNLIPEKRWTDKAVELSKYYIGAPAGEKAVFAVVCDKDTLNGEMYIYTKNGNVKRSMVASHIVGKPYYQVMSLKDDDEVIGGDVAMEGSTILFVSTDGQCVNTITEDYPIQGRIAGGVIGISLNDGEKAVFATQMPQIDDETNSDIVLITNLGLGKRTAAAEFEEMKRARKGVRIIDVASNFSKVVYAELITDPVEIALVDENEELHVLESDMIRRENRTTKGKPVARGVKISKIVSHTEQNS
ncbi:MAG: DNA topoisomerase (ATP-hydrolyzing) [Bacillota bacterium]